MNYKYDQSTLTINGYTTPLDHILEYDECGNKWKVIAQSKNRNYLKSIFAKLQRGSGFEGATPNYLCPVKYY